MSDPTIPVTEGGLELPAVDILTGRGAIFGKSGVGKSTTVGIIVEELLEQNFPLLIIDTDGEYYSLKEEYEVLHVGATDECDMVVGSEHADAIARVALDENVPIILDVSGFVDQSDIDQLVREVVLAIFQLGQSRQVPFPIFVEEAHEFIPEEHPDETAEALITVAKRGRKRGLGLTAISQRPANVTKEVITQANWRVWHQLTWKNDTQVVRDVLSPEYAQAVQDLAAGEAILDADFLDDPRTVKFRRKRTFDLGATPGLDDFERPELQPVSEDIIETLRSISEEAEEEEERIEQLQVERDRLRSRVETLEDELERREAGEEAGADPEVLEDLRAEKRGVERDLASLEEEHEEAQSALDEREDRIEKLEAEVEDLQALRDDVEEAKNHLRSAESVLGMDVDETAELEAEFRERVESLEAEVDRLENENERLRDAEGVVTIPTEYAEFYEHPIVEEAIENAIDEGTGTAKAVWAVVFTIADMSGPVGYDEIQERGGYSSHSSVSKAATALESRGVIKTVDKDPKQVDFNFDSMAEIERKNKIREDMEDRIEQKVS